MSEGDTITTEWLPSNGPARGGARAATAVPDGDTDLRVALGTPLVDVEQRLIQQMLLHYGNHRERTAAALGMSLKTLYNKLKTYESHCPKPPLQPQAGGSGVTRTTA